MPLNNQLIFIQDASGNIISIDIICFEKNFKLFSDYFGIQLKLLLFKVLEYIYNLLEFQSATCYLF